MLSPTASTNNAEIQETNTGRPVNRTPEECIDRLSDKPLKPKYVEVDGTRTSASLINTLGGISRNEEA